MKGSILATYPSGQVSLYGAQQALTNQNTWLCYKGIEGSIFYLAGPLAPTPGAQSGLALKSFSGLMSPWTSLDLRGARQDGATFTDAVYDIGEIELVLEASGMSPQDIRTVIRGWVGAWDAKKTGTLSVFTPDLGEWWANVRMGKNITDQFTQDYTYSGKQNFTWTAKNYDSFWYGVDSVSTYTGNTVQYIVTSATPGGFGSALAARGLAEPHMNGVYKLGLGDLVGSFTLGLGSAVSSAIAAFSPASVVQSAIEGLVGVGNVIVSTVQSAVWGIVYAAEFIGSLIGSLVSPLIAGVSGLVSGFVGTQTVSVPIQGYMPLTNIGDQPGWPRFLLTGPGTFGIGNGPNSTSLVTIGPLVNGQKVLITTDPRLRSVVDLSPGQAQQLAPYQSLLTELIAFATNNNTPPLLQQFESFFGIVPPQGPLYSLMNGRFDTPLAPAVTGVAPSAQYIAVGLTGGNANSQIVASVTPRRKWPL